MKLLRWLTVSLTLATAEAPTVLSLLLILHLYMLLFSPVVMHYKKGLTCLLNLQFLELVFHQILAASQPSYNQ